MPNKEDCQNILKEIGLALRVNPKLISTRLLSKDDKDDMVQGLIPLDSLVTGVRVWIENGMPDYANGLYERYKPSNDKPMKRYRGLGRKCLESKI